MGFWTNKPKESDTSFEASTKGGRFGLGKGSGGDASEQEQWTGKQELITRSWKGAGVAAVVAGPVALGLVLASAMGADPAPATAPVVAQDTNAESQAGELARQLTIAWLEAKRGDEKSLEAFVDVPGSLPGEALFRVSEPAVAAIERVPAAEFTPAPAQGAPADAAPAGAGGRSLVRDAYSVVVSAWVAATTEDAPMTRRYFQIPVLLTPSGARAASLPSPVAAPAAGSKVETAYRASADRSHPMVVSAQQFLNSMLADSGEISRYTSPGVEISPVTPPIASSVEIETVAANDDLPSANESVRDGQSAQILLTVRLRDEEQRPGMSAQYALTMAARAGRWEVASMDATPKVRALASSSAPAAGESSDSSSPPSVQTPVPAAPGSP
ncbi:conjugal transfer protein [Dietzia sp. CQ4]|uniref:conjugal transfer protein n=1 Tax=Dietzia sp. (strain CQ4) TaxID=370437 RepID=UPI0015FCED7E|nr:conjugal transfer protein [Dietzia sp. CQ4]MBB1033318.1 conjugal transfer protein [Dietzia sp. CQ4]